MSRNDSENGTIKIPSKEWGSFKKTLIDEYNKSQNKNFAMAQQLYVYVKQTYKGKRNLDPAIILNQIDNMGENFSIDTQKLSDAEKQYLGISESSYYAVNKMMHVYFSDMDVDSQYAITRSLLSDNNKFQKPKKSYFVKANAKTSYFPANDGSIHLNHENKSVTWNVDTNNHAVERARNSIMGKVLFKTLGKIKFTRNSGGQITGNDEYNIEDGDGTRYVTASFASEKQTRKLKRW